jgi:hypothetical protein
MAQQTLHLKKAKASKQTAAVKSSARKLAQRNQEKQVTAEERHNMIAEAAYRIAEQRDFQGDRALDDWLQAEAEVDARSLARH